MFIEGTEISFCGMGLFTTNDLWIHPKRCESTYEIIFVTEGTVNIAEQKQEYELSRGDLIVLTKCKPHFGFKESTGKTEFYWVHLSDIPQNLPKVIRDFKSRYLFKELLHYANLPEPSVFSVEAVCAHILAEILASPEKGSQLSEEIYEWVRINATSKLTVQKTADNFGYNNEYISRLMKKKTGMGLKAIIDSFIIKKAKELLCNTDYSSKQISAMLEFSESSAFINFFKYHEGLTPSTYRNRYTKIHMNKK